MISLQRQPSRTQRRRSHPAAFPGLHTVYKISRSSAAMPARGRSVLSALIGGALAGIAEIGAGSAAQQPAAFPGLHSGVQKLPIASGHAGARSFRVVRVIGGALGGIAEIGAGSAAEHPAAFPGLHTVYKNSLSPAGVPTGARLFRVIRRRLPVSRGNCGNRRRPRRSTPDGVPGPPYVRMTSRSSTGHASARSFRVSSALIGGALAGICGNRRRPRRSTPDSVPGPLIRHARIAG